MIFEKKISVVANKPFLWSKGVRLRARCNTIVAIPAEILIKDETLASIIELSNSDARIAFQEAVKSGDGFSAILIELQSGETLKLNRSTEAVAMGVASDEVIFDAEN